MSYVFDNSPLSALFRNYYRKTFPTLWGHFDGLAAQNRLVSTREVLREIEDSAIESLVTWAKDNRTLFATPTAAEGAFVAKIYAVRRFQQNIEQKKLLRGGKVADAFVIARAACEDRTVVTGEVMKPNAVRFQTSVRISALNVFLSLNSWKPKAGRSSRRQRRVSI